MSVRHRASAVIRAAKTSLLRAIAPCAAAFVALSGCTGNPPPVAGADPSDPDAHVARAGYRSTFGAYVSQRPVAPSSWREQNDRAAPAPKAGQ